MTKLHDKLFEPINLVDKTGGMTPDQIGNVIGGNFGSKYASTPEGFDWPESLPEVIAYKNGDFYDCNIKPEDLIDFSQFTNTLYVDINRPNSSGDGSSWSLAEKGLSEAIDTAISSGLPTRILVRGGVYPRVYSFGSLAKTLTAPICIEAVYGRVTTGPFDFLTYSQNGTYPTVYEVARSSVQQCIDPSRTENGKPLRLTGVQSILECSETAGSFYTDDVNFYVHPFGSEPATEKNTLPVLNARNSEFFASNNDFYIRGFDLIGGSVGCAKFRSGSTNKVIIDSCSAIYSMSGDYGSESTTDGFVVLDCGLFAAFDSEASYNSKDGFNFHENSGVIPSGLLVNCCGYSNGELLSGLSCNGVTAHDGVKLIDIGGEWLGSIGTNAGHVSDDTQVWHFGSVAGDSDGDVYNGGSIDYGAFGVWSGAAEMWLDSCRSVGSIVSVKASGTANAYVRDMSGTGEYSGNVSEY